MILMHICLFFNPSVNILGGFLSPESVFLFFSSVHLQIIKNKNHILLLL